MSNLKRENKPLGTSDELLNVVLDIKELKGGFYLR